MRAFRRAPAPRGGPSLTSLSTACAFVLLVTLVLLVPFAHATPPDPSWIDGVYDAADFDDVVTTVIDGGATGRDGEVAGELLLAPTGHLSKSPTDAPPRVTLRVTRGRSPPA